MATFAYLPIAADRAGAVVRSIRFVGRDLTGITLAMEIRAYYDEPGTAKLVLGMAASNAEGLSLTSVEDEDGITVSTVQIRINETTMEDNTKIPYDGEQGQASELVYGLIGTFSGDKKTLTTGPFVALPTAYGSNSAPSDRPYSPYSTGTYNAWSTAQVTFSDDDVTVTIDGLELLQPLVAIATEAAEDAADSAASAAGSATTASSAAATAAGAEAAVLDAIAGLPLAATLPLQAVSLTALRAFTVASLTLGRQSFLSAAGRAGTFEWKTGDQSAAVTADPGMGNVVPPSEDATGASGAHFRVGGFDSWLNVKWFAAVGDGVTDDTVAIQRAIDRANALGGRTIYAPAGIYAINGAQVAGPSGATAQILFPYLTAVQGARTIEIVGEQTPATFDGTIGGLSVITGGTIFKSNTATTTGAIFGGSGTVLGQTAAKVVLRRLIVRAPSNPGCIAIDANKFAFFQCEDVRVDTGQKTEDTTEPSHTNGIGIRMPNIDNGAQSTLSGLVAITGFYDGIQFGEHDVFHTLTIFACKNAARFRGANYPTMGRYLLYCNCQNGLVFQTAAHPIDLTVAVEHYNPAGATAMPAWMTPVTDFKDPSNYAKGKLRWRSILGYVSGGDLSATAFVRDGGFFCDIRPLERDVYKNTTFTHATNQAVATATWTRLLVDTMTDDFNYLAARPGGASNFEIRLKQLGTITISVSVRFAANATGYRGIRIIKSTGGTNYVVEPKIEPALTGSQAHDISLSAITTVGVSTDVFFVEVYQTSGGSLNVLAAALTAPGVGEPTDVSSPRVVVNYV